MERSCTSLMLIVRSRARRCPGILIRSGHFYCFLERCDEFAGSLCAREQFLPGIAPKIKSFQAHGQRRFSGVKTRSDMFLLYERHTAGCSCTYRTRSKNHRPKTVTERLLTPNRHLLALWGHIDPLFHSDDRSMSRQNFTRGPPIMIFFTING